MARKKTKPRASPILCDSYGGWTESRYWSFIRSALRSASNRWPAKFDALKRARREYTGTDKRTKWEFKCAICNKWHKSTNISVDHIIPAGSLNSYDDLVPFVKRLFIDVDGMQVLCTDCHKTKTQQERAETRERKEAAKADEGEVDE